MNDYTKKSKQGDPLPFIAREGGKRREITREERDAGYERWVATESGKAKSQMDWSFLLLTILPIATITIALLAVLVRKYKRSKA